MITAHPAVLWFPTPWEDHATFQRSSNFLLFTCETNTAYSITIHFLINNKTEFLTCILTVLALNPYLSSNNVRSVIVIHCIFILEIQTKNLGIFILHCCRILSCIKPKCYSKHDQCCWIYVYLSYFFPIYLA